MNNGIKNKKWANWEEDSHGYINTDTFSLQYRVKQEQKDLYNSTISINPLVSKELGNYLEED